MRKALAISLSALTALGVAAAAPASAACTDPSCTVTTTATFEISGGGLSISVDGNNGTRTLLNGTSAPVIGTANVSGTLNQTTVSDQRGLALADWQVQVSGSEYAGPSGSTAIPASAAKLSVLNIAAGTLPTGLNIGMAALNVTPALAGVTLGGTGALFMSGKTVVKGTYSYTPTLTVSIPATAVAGTYSGTVTQTVS